MNRSGIRDDVAPWSFFLPVMLAVVVGVLVAGLVQRGIDMVFGNDVDAASEPALARMPAGDAPAQAVPAEAAPTPERSREAAPEPASRAGQGEPQATVAIADPATAAAVGESGEAVAAPAVPVLPGAMVARRDGAPEACINGTIAIRDANGWQQRLENDAPVACTEQSSAPPH